MINKQIESYKNGKLYDAYLYFGSFYSEKETLFRVFAPNAKEVSVTGDFNNWTETKMENINGVWSCTVPNVKEKSAYKYKISNDYKTVYKADPFARETSLRPKSDSIVIKNDNFKWEDDKWFKERESKNYFKRL